MLRNFGLIFSLACVTFFGAGEFVFASPAASDVSLTAVDGASSFAGPVTEELDLFPGLVKGPGGEKPEVLSAHSEVTLAWMEEGERRKWFTEQEKDVVLAKVESRVRLKANQGGSFQLGLAEPETGYYLGLSLSAAGNGQEAQSLPVQLEELVESGGAPGVESFNGHERGLPLHIERWASGGGAEGRQRRPATQMGEQVYPRLYIFPLSLSKGESAELKLQYFTFLHRQQNAPLLRMFNWGRFYKVRQNRSFWGNAPRGAGQASYFCRLLFSPLATFAQAGPGRAQTAFELALDFGRPVNNHWLKLEPLGIKLQQGQRLRYNTSQGSLRDLGFSISDGILKHYPPMSLKQKEASLALVEECAKQDGRY